MTQLLEHLLPLQKTWVQFPAPKQGSQLPASSDSRELSALFWSSQVPGTQVLHAHTCQQMLKSTAHKSLLCFARDQTQGLAHATEALECWDDESVPIHLLSHSCMCVMCDHVHMHATMHVLSSEISPGHVSLPIS